jgi:hypothetical protein
MGYTVVLLILVLPAIAISVWVLVKIFSRKNHKKQGSRTGSADRGKIQLILDLCRDRLVDSFMQIPIIYSAGLRAFLNEDITDMKVALVLKKQLNKNLEKFKKELFNVACELESEMHSGHYYIEINDYQKRMVHSINLFIQPLHEHLNNSHKPFVKSQEDELKNLERDVSVFFTAAGEQVVDQFKQMGKLTEMFSQTIGVLERMEKAQIQRTKSGQVNTRNSILYLNTLTETKNMLNFAMSLLKTCQKLVRVKS